MSDAADGGDRGRPAPGDGSRVGAAADHLVRAAYVFFALALAAAIYLVAVRGDDGGDAAAGVGIDASTDGSEAVDAVAEQAVATSAAPVSTAAEPTSTASSPASSSSPASPSTTEAVAELRGVLDGERVAITGTVPSEEAAASVVEAVSRLLAEEDIEAELVVEPLAPFPTGLTIAVADNIGFAPGSATISPTFFPLLDRLAALMELDPNVSMVVSGHADTGGDRISNLALSQRRAEAARSYLVDAGINQFRIEAVGRGDTEPVADNETLAGRVQNRRIELELIGLRFEAGP